MESSLYGAQAMKDLSWLSVAAIDVSMHRVAMAFESLFMLWYRVTRSAGGEPLRKKKQAQED